MTFLEMNHLSFGYGKKEKVFNNLKLSLNAGGICGLLGANGAGKTTLLKIISGLVFPRAGSCQVLGQNPSLRHPSFLQDVFFLSEDQFVPALTAHDYVKFYGSFYPRFDVNYFHESLNEFGLPPAKLISNFSYGQKKKFLIAFGLATHSKLFILDEPTNGLDIPSKSQFRKLLASAINDEKLFIISTHQVHDVENLIDTVVVLDEGNILLQENLFEISKRLAFAQLPVEPDPDECFYYEKHLGGYASVIHNKMNQETHVDLELLFNAILTNKEKTKQLFSRG